MPRTPPPSATPEATPRRGALAALLAGGLLALAVGGWLLFRPKPGDPYGLAVEMPASRPTGEPVAIAHGVRAGDRFVTTVDTKARIALDKDYQRTEQGMRVDAKLEVAHEVAARPEGGLRSTLTWKLLDASSDVPGRQGELWEILGSSKSPVVRVVDRDASGRPLEALPPANPFAALLLDLLLSGFSDPTLAYLPRGRDVRVGEAWSLFQEVGDFPGLERGIQVVTETAGDGFPVLARAGTVVAEGVETHAGEETLRLRLVVSLSMEGDTRPPATPGRITMSGKGEGTIWVSRATGLPVESTLGTELRSILTREGLGPVERAIKQSVKTVTRRAGP